MRRARFQAGIISLCLKGFSMRIRYPCTFEKACYVHWAVLVKGWSMTQAAVEIKLNVGTVSHVIHGHRFSGAFPIPMPGFS
jgi:hypothetical protein